jgi:tetratricopeptide (TPR) repeat protein
MTAISLAKMCLRIPGREGEALALYEQTTRDFTGTPIEWECRREWARALGSYYGPSTPEAAERASEALAPAAIAAPGSFSLAHARYNLAEALATLSRSAGALGVWEALGVCELAAADLDAYRGEEWAPHCLMLLIDLQQKLDQWDDAIVTAERYIKLFPDRDVTWARFRIGLSYVSKRMFDRAIVEFDRVLADPPTNQEVLPIALFHKSICQKALGRLADAKATFEQFLRVYPEHYLAARARQELDHLATQ